LQELEAEQRKLRESEAELRLITDTVPGLIAQVDREERYQFVNAAYERWYGRPNEEIVGRTIRELVGPEGYEQIRHHVEAALAGEQVTFENTLAYPEGEKTVLATYTPRRDPEGWSCGFYILVMDISARKQMEEAMRESEERFKTLANNAPVLIWINGPDSKAQFVNQSYIEFTGRPMKDLLGEDWVELVHPDDVEGYINSYQTAFRHRQRFETDFRFRRADGEYRWMKSVGLPRYQEDGVFLGYIGCTLDIHEGKRAELTERLLAEAGKTLAGSLDYTVRLSNVARLAVPRLADLCAVTLFDENWAVVHSTVAHVDPARMALARQWQQRYSFQQEELVKMARPWQRGQAELYPEVSDAMLEASARDAEHYQILRDLKLHSAMVVPLMAQDRVAGVMTFVQAESGQHYNEQDLALAEELARRAAIALENARTYQAEQVARQTAEQVNERLISLQAVTARLSQALTPTQVAEIVLTQGLSTIGINTGLIALLTNEGAEFELVAAIGYSAETIARVRRELANSGQTELGLYPALIEENSHAAWVILPLVVENRPIGDLSFSFPEDHQISPEEREFSLTLARQCAQALDRTQLYEAEQKARAEAEAAQESIALLAEIRERHRLAQELHDNVAQALGYLNLKVSQIHDLFASNELESAEADLRELKQVIGEAYTDIRGEIFNLRSASSAEEKFLDTLRRYIDKYKRFYRLDIQLLLETDEAYFDFPPEVTTSLIRSIQEALMNVRKHARVDEALIQISRQGEQIRIRIEDEGRGFDLAAQKAGSFGLKIMRERLESINGRLEIDTEPGHGTRITLFYSDNA
jgi:PAS domain S-box-containing protein